MRAQEIHDQAKIEREELRIEKIQKSRKIEGIKTDISDMIQGIKFNERYQQPKLVQK